MTYGPGAVLSYRTLRFAFLVALYFFTSELFENLVPNRLVRSRSVRLFWIVQDRQSGHQMMKDGVRAAEKTVSVGKLFPVLLFAFADGGVWECLLCSVSWHNRASALC
jgi:hypothetical protein